MHNPLKIKVVTDPAAWEQPKIIVPIEGEDMKIVFVPDKAGTTLEEAMRSFKVSGYNEVLYDPSFQAPEKTQSPDKEKESGKAADRYDTGSNFHRPAPAPRSGFSGQANGARGGFSGQGSGERQREAGAKRYREHDEGRRQSNNGRGRGGGH